MTHEFGEPNGFKASSNIQIGPGSLKVAPRPRGGDWLELDLLNLQKEGYSFVVSLLTPAEEVELGLTCEGSFAGAMGMKYFAFPIIDRSVPGDRDSFDRLAATVLDLLKDGEKGFFHCRAGLGRAPLLGCAVMVKAGYEVDEAWRLLAEFRGQSVPDTAEQRSWITSPPLSLEEALTKLLNNDV